MCSFFFTHAKKNSPFSSVFPPKPPLLKNKLESLNEWTHTDAFLGKRCATRARALWWYDTLERDDFDDVEAEEEQQPPRRPPLFDGKKEEREKTSEARRRRRRRRAKEASSSSSSSFFFRTETRRRRRRRRRREDIIIIIIIIGITLGFFPEWLPERETHGRRRV